MKTIRSITAILMVLTMCVCLMTGCGGGPAGKWVLVSATYGDEEMTAEDFGSEAIIELKSDGTALVYLTGDESDGGEGEWTYEDDELVIDGMEVEYDGETITIDMYGVEMVFERA